MKRLSTRPTALALALAGGVFAAGQAGAMHVAENGIGEVLLFPYYTTREGLDSLFWVINASNYTAALRIRFREALNGRETLSLNVLLSPYDVWNGAITADPAGGALLRTYDQTCTEPALPVNPASGGRERALGSYAYDGLDGNPKHALDGAGTSIDRVREGYFEVILMGVSSRTTTASANSVEYNAKHVNGVPRNCASVAAGFDDLATHFSSFSAPESILLGHATYIDVANGKAIDVEPTAIERFAGRLNPNSAWPETGHLVQRADQPHPDLTDGDPNGIAEAHRQADGETATASTQASAPYASSVDGISGLLATNAIIN